MYIKSLTLRNVRSYIDNELEFSPSINLLVGANNSGKSTILKSLYKLQKGYSLDKNDIRKTQNSSDIFIRFNEVTESDINLFRIKNGDSSPAFFDGIESQEVVVSFKIKSGENQIEEAHFYDPNKKSSIFKGYGQVGVGYEDHEVQLIPFSSLPDKENERNFIYPFFAKRKNYYHSNNRGFEATYLVHEDLSNLASKIQKIGNASHYLFEEFIKLCDDILGFRVGNIAGENKEDRIGIIVKDGATIPIESMGEGVINILGLIVILLTEDHRLFLIEELENDLHPAALKKVLQLIIEKSNKNQFIISTHSNIVVKYLGSVPNNQLFHIQWSPFEKEGSGPWRIPTSEVVQVPTSSDARRMVLESLGYDLFDFNLYSGFLILEESSAEQIIRDFLMPQFTPWLVGRLRTIASQGAEDLLPKFNDLHRLFLFVHTELMYRNRAWAVGDGDEAGKRNIEKLQQKFSTWTSKHFITFNQPAFEHYYPKQFQEEVNQILAISDKQRKKEKKNALLRQVIDWAQINPQEAKNAFEVSAQEVIQVLFSIEQQMKVSAPCF